MGIGLAITITHMLMTFAGISLIALVLTGIAVNFDATR